MAKHKKLLIIGGVFIIALCALVFFRSWGGSTIITGDTFIPNNFTLAAGKLIILKNNAKFSVGENMTIDGSIICDGGALRMHVGGTLRVNGTLNCILPEGTTPEHGVAIVISAAHAEFNDNARIIANGHVELMNDEQRLLTSPDGIANVYNETGEDSGVSPRIGPLSEKDPTRAINEAAGSSAPKNSAGVPSVILGGTWYLGDGNTISGGTITPPPPKGVKNILVDIDFGQNGDISMQNFHLIGPSGRGGSDDLTTHCTSRGGDGENAFRMRVNTGTLMINGFRLELGSGGNGGSAQTTTDCAPALAVGGAGGEAGNFKMTASEKITIVHFEIIPGAGGKGGNARAYGKDGGTACPGADGGDATATGGDGAVNKTALAARGAIAGIDNLTAGRFEGGAGGGALAKSGNGGAGVGCSCRGGRGGDGRATGGRGGDAQGDIPMGTIEAHGGDGGNGEAAGGRGGDGGNCPLKPEGGTGGKGGDARVYQGIEGKGTTASGNKGVIKTQPAGDGGKGGDGCGAGLGGAGGIGAPLGSMGANGTRACPNDSPVSGTLPPPEAPLVSAILYHGKYLPVDQLMIENKAGCGAEHWRALEGVVKATDGTMIPDTQFQCGFGKINESRPEMVPALVEHVDSPPPP